MLFQNILVPYDESTLAKHAFKVAVDLAKKYDSKVTVVTCLEGPQRWDWYYDSKFFKSVLKQHKKEAEKKISKLIESAKKSDIKITTEIFEAPSIVKALTNYAKSRKIDLIVMGSHGRTKLDKIIMGSVTNGVSQRVNCPVLIIK